MDNYFPKFPVIANQCAHWCGNPFPRQKRYGLPRRFAPRKDSSFRTIVHSNLSHQLEQFFLLPQHAFDLLDVLLREFGVVEALQAAVGQVYLVHAAAT